MNQFKKNWIITFLVVLNVAILCSIWLKPSGGKGKKHPPIEKMFQKELDLSNEQVKQFEKLRAENKEMAKPFHQERQENKKFMIEVLNQNPPNRIAADSLAENIGKLETQLDKLLIEHFLALQKVCNDSQKERLGEIFLKATKPKKPRK